MIRISNLLLVIFLLSVTISPAQQKQADSLVALLVGTKNDIDKARLLNDIAVRYQAVDPSKTIHYAIQAQKLAQKIGDKLTEGNALLSQGNANIILGNYPEAIRKFTDAQTIFEKEVESGASREAAEIKNGLARTYGSIGIVFSEQSNYPRALQYHLKALRIYEEMKMPDKSARVQNNIGIVYKSQGEVFKALEYFVRCLNLQEKLGDPTAGFTTTNIGNIYLEQKDWNKAFDYYNRALKLFAKNPDARGLGELYNNLGIYYKNTGNGAKALECYDTALNHFGSIDDKFGASDTYALIGEIHFARGDYEKALSNTEQSLQLGKQLAIPERIRDSEKMLSDIYQKMGNSSQALAHFREYVAANDSISNYENIRNGVRAEMNFEFEKKEALRKKEAEKKDVIYREQAKRHEQQIFFIVLSILLVFGILFLINNRRQLKKNLTLQKELAEYEQKALHLQMNPHFVFNCLGSISSFIVQNGTDQAIKYLSKFSKLMRLTLEYSKESLIPIDREIESLQNYLELEQLRFNKVFDFSISKSTAIEDDMGIPPLLLQPFVENAIIHGLVPKQQPGKISVDFSVSGESLICTITDDGIGFNKSQELKESLVSVHKSMALDITRKRLEMMEAYTSKKSHVDIRETMDESGRITGTKVVLSLPVQYISKNTNANS